MRCLENFWPTSSPFRPSLFQRYVSSSTRRLPRRPLTALPEFDTRIDPYSLERTIEAHRDANRASRIRRVVGYNGQPEVDSSRPRLDNTDEKRMKHGGNANRNLYEDGTVTRHLTTTEGSSSGRISPFRSQRRKIKLKPQWQVDEDTPQRWKCPWLSRLPRISQKHISSSAIDRLSAEIVAFEQYMTPVSEEKAAAAYAFQDLRKHIKGINSGVKLEIVGSRVTGLARSFSDIDVLLSVPQSHEWAATQSDNEQDVATQILSSLWPHFSSKGSFSTGQQILQPEAFLKDARVPIIQLRHKVTGLSFQLTCEHSTHASDDCTKSLLHDYKNIRGLFAVLKHALDIRGLSNSPKGGLSSYPLVNLIAISLKLSEEKSPMGSIGSQLLFLLDLYSQINFETTTLSLNDPDTMTRHQSVVPGVKKAMHLRDPADPLNSLGKSAWLIKHIQSLLIFLQHQLTALMKTWDATTGSSAANGELQQLSLLEPLLAADYRIFEHDRVDLRRSIKQAGLKL